MGLCLPDSTGCSGNNSRQRNPRRKWEEPPVTSKSIPDCKERLESWRKTAKWVFQSIRGFSTPCLFCEKEFLPHSVLHVTIQSSYFSGSAPMNSKLFLLPWAVPLRKWKYLLMLLNSFRAGQVRSQWLYRHLLVVSYLDPLLPYASYFSYLLYKKCLAISVIILM